MDIAHLGVSKVFFAVKLLEIFSPDGTMISSDKEMNYE